jgi:antitoxin FitA
MATLTIQNLDRDLEARLKARAALDGHSVEEEAELLLRRALAMDETPLKLGSYIHGIFAELGGVELELPPRTDLPRIIDFDE